MSEEFGPNFITLTDEDGNEIELEYVDAIEVDGQTYMAFFPTVDEDEDEAKAEEFGLVILKSITENGEELLEAVEDDEIAEVGFLFDTSALPTSVYTREACCSVSKLSEIPY